MNFFNNLFGKKTQKKSIFLEEKKKPLASSGSFRLDEPRLGISDSNIERIKIKKEFSAELKNKIKELVDSEMLTEAINLIGSHKGDADVVRIKNRMNRLRKNAIDPSSDHYKYVTAGISQLIYSYLGLKVENDEITRLAYQRSLGLNRSGDSRDTIDTKFSIDQKKDIYLALKGVSINEEGEIKNLIDSGKLVEALDLIDKDNKYDGIIMLRMSLNRLKKAGAGKTSDLYKKESLRIKKVLYSGFKSTVDDINKEVDLEERISRISMKIEQNNSPAFIKFMKIQGKFAQLEREYMRGVKSEEVYRDEVNDLGTSLNEIEDFLR